jgi:hypothetical protein
MTDSNENDCRFIVTGIDIPDVMYSEIKIDPLLLSRPLPRFLSEMITPTNIDSNANAGRLKNVGDKDGLELNANKSQAE